MGAAGTDGIVAATIENSADNEPEPIELRADTLNLYVVPVVRLVFV